MSGVTHGNYWYGAFSSQPSVGTATGDGLACDRTGDKEEELVERARRDPLQFAPLYDRHFQRIYRFAYSRVREQTAAEDVTSEVFIKALNAMPRYRHTGRPFAAWLYRIAANTIADRCRTIRPSQTIEDICDLSVGSRTEELAVHRDEIRRIWILVDALPSQQRTALVLKFQEDLKIEDIAGAMGKTPGAIKLLIHRGLRRLRADADALRPVDDRRC